MYEGCQCIRDYFHLRGVSVSLTTLCMRGVNVSVTTFVWGIGVTVVLLGQQLCKIYILDHIMILYNNKGVCKAQNLVPRDYSKRVQSEVVPLEGHTCGVQPSSPVPSCGTGPPGPA